MAAKDDYIPFTQSIKEVQIMLKWLKCFICDVPGFKLCVHLPLLHGSNEYIRIWQTKTGDLQVMFSIDITLGAQR
jgi:hypothetical protein